MAKFGTRSQLLVVTKQLVWYKWPQRSMHSATGDSEGAAADRKHSVNDRKIRRINDVSERNAGNVRAPGVHSDTADPNDSSQRSSPENSGKIPAGQRFEPTDSKKTTSSGPSHHLSDYADYADQAVKRVYESAAGTFTSMKDSLLTHASSVQQKVAGDKLVSELIENAEHILKKYIPMTSDGAIRPRSEVEHPKHAFRNQPRRIDKDPKPEPVSASDVDKQNMVSSTAATLLQQFYQLQAQLHAHLHAQPKPVENKSDGAEESADNANRDQSTEKLLPESGFDVGHKNLIDQLAALPPLSLQMLSNAAANFKFISRSGAAASQAAAALDPKHPQSEQSKTAVRQRIMARRPIDKRTRALVESLATSQSTLSRLHRVEQLSQHLLKFPEAKYEAVRENVVSCLLEFLHDAHKAKTDEADGLVLQLHQCLALVGYAFPPRSAGIRILSIDGGGARGVIALELLCALERRTGKPCHKLFDIMVGVSAGSIIVSALGLYKYSAEETLEIFRQIARELFTRNRLWGVGQLVWSHSYYDTSHYEASLRKLTGERLMIDFIESERSPKVAIISSVLGPVNYGPQVAPYIFRNYNIPTGRLAMHEGSCSHKVWQAIRASSAATGLFRELQLDGRIHQDGGILANNPSAIAIHEAHQIWGKNSRIQALVSVGNGKFLPSHGVYDKETMKILGNATLRSKLGSIVASATDTEAVHQMLLELLPAKQYFRLNPRLREDFPIDVSDPVLIEAMLDDARGFVRDNGVLLGQVAQSIDMPRPISTMLSDMMKVWRDRTRRVESGIWYRASLARNLAQDGLLQNEAPLGDRDGERRTN